MQQWLKRVERQGHHTAVASLGLALNRLTTSPVLRLWLEWPTNRFDILTQGALLFACQGTSWERQHLLRSVLLAVLPMINIRVVIHGFPWLRQNWVQDLAQFKWLQQIVISNGPQMAEALTVLVQTQTEKVSLLADRFLGSDPQLVENLALLQRGEGICVQAGRHWPVSW